MKLIKQNMCQAQSVCKESKAQLWNRFNIHLIGSFLILFSFHFNSAKSYTGF